MNGWNSSNIQSLSQSSGRPKRSVSTKISSSWHALKRGLASLFVCVFVIGPVILTFNQWASVFGLHVSLFSHNSASKSAVNTDSRKATQLPAMQTRAIDAHNPAIKPFQQPLISVTFDDGWESIYTKAAPLLQKYGVPTTQYVLSGVDSSPAYMTFDQIKSLRQAGNDIACHSINHPDLTTLNAADLTNQLTTCKSVVEQKLGITITDFASPYGHTNDTTIAAIQQTYRSQRNTNGDITSTPADDQDINTAANFNRYNIIAVTIRKETTQAELNAAIDYTVAHNGWLVLTYHDIENNSSPFAVDAQTLDMQLATISKAPSRIVTMRQALDALQTTDYKTAPAQKN